MTTIVTKNGSGAPLASDLVQGELAVDLTNKRLYTEDSGGTVIEVGTNPSTIDINAGTIDGTVIGGSSAAAGTFTTFTSTGIDDNATSTAITIDSSENVGIGTTSPASQVDILGTNSRIRLDGSSASFQLLSRNTLDTVTNPIIFDAQTYTFNSAGSTRAVIDASGILLVGCTSEPSASVKGMAYGDLSLTGGDTSLVLSGGANTGSDRQVSFVNGNGIVGTINTSGTATIYATSSDERLKENIVDAPAGNIDAIRVRSFDWKADGSHQTYGMVAQELIDVAPEAVSQGETEDDMWGVDYSKLVPMMIKEIQDLKAKVKELESR